MDTETAGYHIFLEPKGDLKAQCDRIIQSLARQYGGPVFPAHITLAARIAEDSYEDVLEKAAQLASELTPFQVTLGPRNGESSFFRAFYVEVQQNPELMQAHNRACEIYGLDAIAFRPHLSLFYGHIDDGTRNTMNARIDKPEGSFQVEGIHVYRTQGTADVWEKIGEYALSA